MSVFVCDRCKAIPADTCGGNPYDFQSFNDMLRSANDGCATCTIFVRGFERRLTEEPNGPVKISYDPKYPSLGLLRCGRTFGMFTCFIRTKKPTSRRLSGKVRNAPAVDCEKNIAIMRDLVDHCVRNHANCQLNATRRRPPTRLIYVGHRGEETKLRIVSSSRCQSNNGRYHTLSHCWGTVPSDAPWKLTTKLLSDYGSNIPMSYLPRTLQEAIELTRKLGEKHLWIDSLCIIQDPPEDWAAEAKLMADVYSGSLCTISAASDSANGGCFLERDATETYPVKLRLLGQGTDSYYTVRINRYVPADDAAMNATPVNTRAWCFQERDLSLRMIHFTSRQFIYICRTVFANEVDLYPVLPYMDDDTRRATITSLGWELRRWGREPVLFNSLTNTRSEYYEQDAQSSIPHRKACDDWYDRASEYSRRDITFPSDRLPAIEGLANSYMAKIPGVYAAGIWEVDIMRGLLWEAMETVLHRPSPAIAPTWSWACLNAPITYLHGHLHQRSDICWEGNGAEWLAAKISIEESPSITKYPAFLSLHVTDQLLVATCGPFLVEENPMKAHVWFEKSGKKSEIMGEIILHVKDDADEGMELSCLLVHRFDRSGKRSEALALKPTKQQDVYLRMGHMSHVAYEAFKEVEVTDVVIV